MAYSNVYKFLWTMIFCCMISNLCAQNDQELNKIAASQGGASPLLFEVDVDQVRTIVYEGFQEERECIARRGIPNFIAKLRKGGEVTVAFIGGSLTQANFCYRVQIAAHMQRQYPTVRFKWVNAGISGTGTDLGAFRIKEQVLSQNPDLVLIDFAVNGAYAAGMEGMIRQIIKHDPYTDICLVYAILGIHTVMYQDGKVPEHIQHLDNLADHYQIPSIHLGMEAAYLEKEQKLLWKGTADEARDRILFSKDGIHPLETGGDLYAAAIARGIKKMQYSTKRFRILLPDPLYTKAWEEAAMYEPQHIAYFDPAWKRVSTANSHLKTFGGWFDTVMTADREQAICSFSFEGDLFGVFDIGGPEVGQLEIWVDNKKVSFQMDRSEGFQVYNVCESQGDTILNRFNRFCNNRYRGQYDVVQLPYGVHHVRIGISAVHADKVAILGPEEQADIRMNPEKYSQTAIYLGRILLRGRPLTQIKTS